VRKIGIMGGTFNPVHNGHIKMAEAAYQQFHLDEIWFMPTKHPPHKENIIIASDTHRKEMIQLAITEHPCFSLSCIELERRGTTYTVDTLRYLKEIFPEDMFYFIIGADSLLHFETWKNPEEILQMATILSAPRYPSTSVQDIEQKKRLQEKYNADISFIQMEPVHVSSSDVRKARFYRTSVEQLVPKEVYQYMNEHHLYETMPVSMKELEKLLAEQQSDKRYRHTLGVKHMSGALAMCYQENLEHALLAGLLHDCAKTFTAEELLVKAREYQLPISATEEKNPFLLHGKVGAYITEHAYHITEPDILNAITYHTTGRPGMSMLEKIVFVADYIEPSRKLIHGLAEIRSIVFKDLDYAVYLTLKNTVEYLESQFEEDNIDDMTAKTYEYYKALHKEKNIK